MSTPQNSKMKGSAERWPNRWLNDDHIFLSFWVLTDTSSTQRELQNDFLAGKKPFLLHCCCCFFFCCCLFCCLCFCYCFFSITYSVHVHQYQTPLERWGTHKKCNRFSPYTVYVIDSCSAIRISSAIFKGSLRGIVTKIYSAIPEIRISCSWNQNHLQGWSKRGIWTPESRLDPGKQTFPWKGPI